MPANSRILTPLKGPVALFALTGTSRLSFVFDAYLAIFPFFGETLSMPPQINSVMWAM